MIKIFIAINLNINICVNFNIIAKKLNITELEYLNSTLPPLRGGGVAKNWGKWSAVEENFYGGGVEKDYRN